MNPLIQPARSIAPVLCIAALGNAAQAAGLRVENWGSTQAGQSVQRVTLENRLGMRLAYVDLGATIVAVEVPDRRGRLQNVVLSLPDPQSYERAAHKVGGIMGRYAGRIANARFSLDGQVVNLVPGANGTTLHGGPDGYDKRVWQRHDFSDAGSLGSVFHLTSPAGDQQFPGSLEVDVTYRLLRERNEFRIEYAARTDAPTVLNLTNHSYFNLAGAGASGLAGHLFQIDADRYAPTDEKKIPFGTLASVAGTPLDFRKPAGIGERLTPGFDHSLVFPHWSGRLAKVALVEETGSGRRMLVSTTEPSLQFNTGNSFDGSEIGSEGIAYRTHDGFALETQHLPDSPNHPDFPGTALYPGQIFHSATSYRFSVMRVSHAKSKLDIKKFH